ncbi:MAG: 50S ribosomal protein L25/general stress protein Ctc [Cytophagales bacterium]|nr:50S ribosomal protein L25/general stress protein Ctc [Bernardetiaceae bacterium]MDW8204903.1 50S ribosomal protein L25/general stress protein Ctc [Cytophagales bacterium]
MKTLEIIGFKRANLGKRNAKNLRNEALVPCVLYGAGRQVHFAVPMILFRPLVYTSDVHMVELNVEGEIYKAILQDVQYHPVNEMIMHADFLELQEDKPIKMNIPVRLKGTAVGVQKGGKLVIKQSKVRVKALPANMPDTVEVDITNLDLGKSIRVRDIATQNFEILTNGQVTLASIAIPRALRGKSQE